MFRYVLLNMVFFLCPAFGAYAQAVSLRGRVTDEKGRPIELAIVALNKSIYSTTDVNGNYSMDKLKPGEYDYLVSFVGYEDVSGTIKVGKGSVMDISMKELNLRLESVTVTAEREALGSKSTIGEEAIKHIQPKSVSDLLQLVPGNLTKNPSLNTLSQASVREIDGDVNNSLGASVVVDGTPVSNDANLQVLSATAFGGKSGIAEDGMSNQTTAGGGTDLRTVSAGNVASVEVISGIPSVEYGNLTSGVVIVKTKAGRTPWELKAQADPRSKLLFLGKGFKLGDGSAVNVSTDYSQSWSDPRRHYLGYDRITASAGWSKVFGKFSLNLKGSFYSNVNTRKTDPQMKEMDVEFSNENIGARFSANGNYTPKSQLITSLDYNIAAQVSKTTDWHKDLVRSPYGMITSTKIPGLQHADFKSRPYYAEYTIGGLPINFFGQLVANRYFQLSERNFTKLKLGVEFTYDANKGPGLQFDLQNPPQSGGSKTLRPRAYSDIPALNTLSAFFSDKSQVDLFAGMTAKLEAGLRVSELFLDAEKSGGHKNIFVAEPRVNASLSILNKHNNPFFEDLSLNGGYGISNKMPTLLYLYPDAAYYDNVSLNRVSTIPGNSIALLTTDIIFDTQNPDLTPAHTTKWELGISWKAGKASGFATFFHENHQHEFGFKGQLYLCNFWRFTLPDGASSPRLEGQDVFYTDAGVDKLSDKVMKTEFNSWGKPSNTTHSVKYGIEYGLDLGTIEAIRTSVNINGAWFHIERSDETPGIGSIDITYDYVPIMPAGAGNTRDRFNSSFRFITHIPEVNLIFTTTLQVVWYESSRFFYNDENNNQRYYDYSYQGQQWLAVEPLGFYDKSGSFTKWDAATHNNSALYSKMMNRYQLYDFGTDEIEPWAMLNIRLTKELGKMAELSFTANNVTNSSRYHTNKLSQYKAQLYPDIYFGAEIKIKF